MQDWVEAYKELSAAIAAGVPEVKWVDLWMEQTANEEDEYPFPFPAVFLEFDSNSIDELGVNTQSLNMNVTVILAVNTLSDTFKGSANQEVALAFGAIMRSIHKTLHGKAGTNYGKLTRIGLRKEVAPPYIQQYSQTYATIIVDDSTAPDYDAVLLDVDQLKIEKGVATPAEPLPPFYDIPMR